MSSENNTSVNASLPKKKGGGRPKRKVYTERHIVYCLFFVCFLASLLLVVLLGLLSALKIPDIRTVSHYRPMQTSYILDRNGEVVEKFYKENRTVISFDELPPLLPEAFVAAEDGRFYEHPGLDFFSVLRAVVVNVRRGQKAHGGSTITQQVARSLLLGREKTYIRKIKEAILAWRIDSLLTKDEILYIYLNQIYLGSGAYGVEAASQTYFAKHVKELTLGEMAILAGLPQAPTTYSPLKHMENAVKRERYVLNRMVDDHYITAEQAQQAFVAGIRLAPEKDWTQGDASYYTSIVKGRVRKLIERPLSQAGVTIYTCLDSRMQSAGAEAVRAGTQAVFARQILKKRKVTAVPQAALICIDACSGQVLSFIGGVEYSKSHFNRAAFAKRQAGSAFKPILFSAALESGWRPDSLILDAPIRMSAGNGKVWSPRNYENEYHGNVTLTTALAHSYNTTAVRLLQRVGIPRVQELSLKMGIHSEIPEDLSVALGSVSVTPLEMTLAYTPFVCDGYLATPHFISKVETSDTYLTPHPVKRLRPVSSATAREMRKMLEQVVAAGTASRVGIQEIPGVSGGKTGTTNDHRDAWFVGFNDSVVTAVWVGNDRNQPLGPGETGAHAAAPIWSSFMKKTELWRRK